MARLKRVGFLVLVIPLFTAGCKDQEVRDYIKNDLHEWNELTILPALEMLCDLERLIYQGIPDGSGVYQPWVDHGPIPSTARRWCSIPGAGDPPAPPQPPPAWGD
jgi:hypothetical protein